MHNLIRKLRDAVVITVSWGILWAALGAVIGLVIGVFNPNSIDPGEHPTGMAWILARVGAISGFIFSVLLFIFERQKTLAELPLFRAVLWGVLASAVFPLLTILERATTTCPFGAISAMVSVAIARGIALRRRSA